MAKFVKFSIGSRSRHLTTRDFYFPQSSRAKQESSNFCGLFMVLLREACESTRQKFGLLNLKGEFTQQKRNIVLHAHSLLTERYKIQNKPRPDIPHGGSVAGKGKVDGACKSQQDGVRHRTGREVTSCAFRCVQRAHLSFLWQS